MDGINLTSEKFFSILDTTLSTLDIDDILTTVVKEIRSLVGARAATLYLIDKNENELYSKVLEADGLREVKVPVAKHSMAGYCALTGMAINVRDAYDASELEAIDPDLSFDSRWDEKSGHRTESVLTMPVKAKGEIVAVFQAVNKPGGFSATDLALVEQLGFILGIAVNNALSYRLIQEEQKLREYIMDDIEEGICILDTKKCVISGNRFLEVMSGMRYSAASMVGRHFFEVFPNLTNTPLEEKIDEALLCGFKKVALLEVLETKIIPYLDDKGEAARLILIFTRV